MEGPFNPSNPAFFRFRLATNTFAFGKRFPLPGAFGIFTL